MAKHDAYYQAQRPEMLRYFPGDSKRCLDIGCGAGQFGQAIKTHFPACEVWGIEMIESAAVKARQVMDQVICGDAANAVAQLPDRSIDVVYFNDCLEHLVDPYTLLQQLKSKLSVSSCVVASIPNVRYYRCLYDLVFNKDWRYTDAGVMDSTHLRFFTEKSIRRMFAEAGYRIDTLEGISPTRKVKARIWSWLTLGYFRDICFQQFAVVARPV